MQGSLLDVDEVADRLHISERHVRRPRASRRPRVRPIRWSPLSPSDALHGLARGDEARRHGGLPHHDLRHTGNTLAAATGASTKELMARMGHASARAALIYQHATRDRDVVIAMALDGMIREVLERGSEPH